MGTDPRPPFLARVWRGSSRGIAYLLRRWGLWLLKGAALSLFLWFGFDLMSDSADAVALAHPGWTGSFMAMATSMCVASFLGLGVWLMDSGVHTRESLIQDCGASALMGLLFGISSAANAVPCSPLDRVLAGLVITAFLYWWRSYGPAGTARSTASRTIDPVARA